MIKSTLNRLLDSVFSGDRFESNHKSIDQDKISQVISQLPFSLSQSQKDAIFKALQDDISYIQGPPGTGKSFTISALAIVSSQLGLKTLIASQKVPAVDIVYEKLRNIMGDNSCLYLSENQNRKDSTRKLIEELLNNELDIKTDSEKNQLKNLEKEINQIIFDRNEYVKKLKKFQIELNTFYESHKKLIDIRNILSEDWNLSKEEIINIKIDGDKELLNKINLFINECEKLRERARINDGYIEKKNFIKLNILVKRIIKKFNINIQRYRETREELLKSASKFSIIKSENSYLKKIVKNQPLESTRKSLYRRDNQLNKVIDSESLVSKYFKLKNKLRIKNLLQEKQYINSLDNFRRRMRWKNSSRAKKANSKINFELLSEIFPIIVGEIKSLHPYIPFKEELFDLVILDESSQVNLAEIFPILFRSKRYCIVGDHKQLGIKAGGVIFINKIFEELTWKKYFSNEGFNLDYKSAEEKDLLVSNSSILNLLRNEQNPISTNPAKLKEHFRSLPMLAEFTSEEFYTDDDSDTGLRIMTALPDKKSINAFLDIEVNTSRTANTKINQGEIDIAFKIIDSFIKNSPIKETKEIFKIPYLQNKKISLGIVCFIRDQVNRMRDIAEKNYSDSQLDKIELMIGTPEEFQGNERDIIILTPSIDKDQNRSKAFMEDPNRFNVATSRAKYFTYFIHGKLPANMNLMNKLLIKMNEGKNDISKSDKGILPIGWSLNLNLCESEFESSIGKIILKLIDSEFKERFFLYNKVPSCGYFLDFVIYDKLTKKALGLDIDGKHYFSSDNNLFDEHLERSYSLKRAGWCVQNIKYWDWFKYDWIEPEEIILKNLRNYLIKYFVESGNIKESYSGYDISKEFNEYNFLSINTLD